MYTHTHTYIVHKETGKHGLFKRTKLVEIILEEVHALNLMNKDFKGTVLNMLKHLKEPNEIWS